MGSFWFSEDPVENNRVIQYREGLVTKRKGVGGFLLTGLSYTTISLECKTFSVIDLILTTAMLSYVQMVSTELPKTSLGEVPYGT